MTPDVSLVDWSRAQFALTAMYHWLFVPLTLGLSFIVAIMETIYVKTGNEEWKRITKFWMTLFGINFAIGVSTGIILEFEFGTNWSNYSWIVGDIFGAPLAVEGIVAFFLESTFIAVMFFGWNKVGKKFHLTSSWLVAIGSNLSALWILVANGWMQFPTGMHFNPDTARSEMLDFWAVLFSPVAINKFLHTITSGYVLASLFVIGVSSWYVIKKRELLFAKRSMVVGAAFGLMAALFLAVTGDGSGYQIAQKQPMKLAAMEGLYKGKESAGLSVVGVLNHSKKVGDAQDDHNFKIEIPYALSFLAHRDPNAFVAGVEDLVYGNAARGIIPTQEKIDKGKIAVQALADYKTAKKEGNTEKQKESLALFNANIQYFGYGYIEKPEDIVPNVPLVYYSFRIMVGLGGFFILLFMLILFFSYKKTIENKKWILRIALLSIPLGYVASQLGWVVAEVGRQPWAIQDLLPVGMSTSHLNTGSVQITFFLFAVLFTALLIAEIGIMIKQIKSGPKGGSHV